MICEYCGNESGLQDNYGGCVSCGAPLKSNAAKKWAGRLIPQGMEYQYYMAQVAQQRAMIAQQVAQIAPSNTACSGRKVRAAETNRR
jgi:hypothetical protein